MLPFHPDWDYLIDSIADAYVFIQQALDEDNIELARFWQDQLSLMTHHLDLWVRERK